MLSARVTPEAACLIRNPANVSLSPPVELSFGSLFPPPMSPHYKGQYRILLVLCHPSLMHWLLLLNQIVTFVCFN